MKKKVLKEKMIECYTENDNNGFEYVLQLIKRKDGKYEVYHYLIIHHEKLLDIEEETEIVLENKQSAKWKYKELKNRYYTNLTNLIDKVEGDMDKFVEELIQTP